VDDSKTEYCGFDVEEERMLHTSSGGDGEEEEEEGGEFQGGKSQGLHGGVVPLLCKRNRL